MLPAALVVAPALILAPCFCCAPLAHNQPTAILLCFLLPSSLLLVAAAAQDAAQKVAEMCNRKGLDAVTRQEAGAALLATKTDDGAGGWLAAASAVAWLLPSLPAA